MTIEKLTAREEEILQSVVQQFVLTGSAVGSRTISKKGKSELSSASIRNVMADLEDKGFLDQPHKSAGRIPTTKGYRHYVDNMISLVKISEREKEIIRKNIGEFSGDIDFILEKTSQVIAKISRQLGLILTPKFEEGILEKLDIMQLASDKILVILSIKDGIAKSILLEMNRIISYNLLEQIILILNERLAGLKIKEIKNTFHNRVKDIIDEKSGLIRLFIESADKLFDFHQYSTIKYTGTSNILSNPEFSDVNKFATLIELFEEKNIIIHLMEKRSETPELKITIGNENEEKLIQECSIITAPYTVGEVDGLLGVIGPMRMAYRRVIPIVDYTAKLITQIFQER
jgi:heat-inducible transcriptional repressor